MDRSNENVLNRSSKAGIITWALLSDRKVIILIIAFALAFDGLICFRDLYIFSGTYHIARVVILAIRQWTCAFLLVLLCVRRKKYSDLMVHFERKTNIELTPLSVNYLNKNRIIFQIYTFIHFLFFVWFTYGVWCNAFDMSLTYFLVTYFGTALFGISCYFAFLRFFIEGCLYIHTCFMRFEHQIDTLNKSTNALSIDDIRKVRRLYCFAVETTEKFNYLFMPITALYFVISTVKSHYSFVFAISAPSLVTLTLSLVEIANFILITYYMVYINHLSTRIYQSVYSLTFKTDSLFANKEVHIFLARIERADVGFTFLDLFVITPTCVTTLATISLTIALATPTLIR